MIPITYNGPRLYISLTFSRARLAKVISVLGMKIVSD